MRTEQPLAASLEEALTMIAQYRIRTSKTGNRYAQRRNKFTGEWKLAYRERRIPMVMSLVRVGVAELVD